MAWLHTLTKGYLGYLDFNLRLGAVRKSSLELEEWRRNAKTKRREFLRTRKALEKVDNSDVGQAAEIFVNTVVQLLILGMSLVKNLQRFLGFIELLSNYLFTKKLSVFTYKQNLF